MTLTASVFALLVAAAPAASVQLADLAPRAPQSCTAEVGAEAADILVEQCLQVSPATRPPCNADNACEMMTDEIARGCAMLDAEDTPDFCADYIQSE